MKVPFSFLTEQFADPEPIFARIRNFLKRCDFTLGEDLEVFERRYAEYTGAKYAIGVGTGTDALFLSLKALDIGTGDEVISAPNSFIATTGAIVQSGARVVYVDSGPDQNISCDHIERAITEKTKAIMPVHWAGAPADMESVLAIASKYRLAVVEDACQALGARIHGKHVGTFGDAGAFSAHPLKPLHVWGDGGIVVTNSDAVADRIKLLRNHGLANRDDVVVYGYNSRFDNLHAIVGNFVFESLDETIEKRVSHAMLYDRAFSQVPLKKFLKIPKRVVGTKHVFHLYIIEAEERDALLGHLQSKGIEAKIHYPKPLHLQPAASRWGYHRGDFPNAERQSIGTLTLPCHQFLSSDQIGYVISEVREFYEQKR